MTDNHKIAICICANDPEELKECEHYIRRLQVPAGYSLETDVVWDAPSIYAGYDELQRASDARYKIYMHQDCFLVYDRMLYELLAAFSAGTAVAPPNICSRESRKYSLLGVIGCDEVPESDNIIRYWNIGSLLQNNSGYFTRTRNSVHSSCTLIQAVFIDGIFIATDTDEIRWRTDFTGWHGYDASICLEMTRAGHNIGVPIQTKPWCLHDCGLAATSGYANAMDRVCEEYTDVLQDALSVKEARAAELESNQLGEYHKTILLQAKAAVSVPAWGSMPAIMAGALIDGSFSTSPYVNDIMSLYRLTVIYCEEQAAGLPHSVLFSIPDYDAVTQLYGEITHMFIRAFIAGERDVQHALKDAVKGGAISQVFYDSFAEQV